MKKLLYLGLTLLLIYSCNKNIDRNQIIGRWTRQLYSNIIDTTEYFANGRFNESLYIELGIDSIHKKTTIHQHHYGFWKLKDSLLVLYQYFNHIAVGNDSQRYNIKVIKDLNSKEDTNSSQIDSSFSKFIIKKNRLIFLPKEAQPDSLVWKKA